MKFSPTFCSSAAFSAATLSGSPFTVTSNVFSTVVSGPPDVTMPTVAVRVTVRSAALRVIEPVRSSHAYPVILTASGLDDAHVTSDHGLPSSLFGSVRSCVTASSPSPVAKPMAREEAFPLSMPSTRPSSHASIVGLPGTYVSDASPQARENVRFSLRMTL